MLLEYKHILSQVQCIGQKLYSFFSLNYYLLTGLLAFPIQPPNATKTTLKTTWSCHSYAENSLVEIRILHNKKSKSINNACLALHDLAPI